MMHHMHQNRNGENACGAFASQMHSVHDRRMNLRQIREAKGLSQRDLAELIGKDQATVQRAEKMSNGATLDTYKRCAEVLDVPLSAIFVDGIDEMRLLIAYRDAGPNAREWLLAMAKQAKLQPPQPEEEATASDAEKVRRELP